MIACGLDFGTSNSAIGIARGDAVALAPLEDDKTLMPSAVFFDYEAHRVLFGSDAVAAYVGQTEGRLMRALKTILGSPLINEKTSLGSRMVPLTEVVGIFVRHLKHKAEAFASQEITAVVHGRPVHFVDGDAEADARAQSVLETIARQAGFNHVVFVPEPIAAAWHYNQTVQAEELVLIADIGGGTSDFSVVRIGQQHHGRIDRTGDILATAGVRIGGTDFDSALSLAAVMPLLGLGTRLVEKDLPMPNALYHELANWPTINFAYTYKNEREVGALVLGGGRAGKGRAAPGGDRQALGPPCRLRGRGCQDRAQRRARCRRVPSTSSSTALPPRRRAAVSSGRSARGPIGCTGRPVTASPRQASTVRRSTPSSSPAAPAACRPCARRSPRRHRGARLATGSDLLSVASGLTQMAGRLT